MTQTKKRKQFTGIVTSDKMQKTVIVRISRLSKHPKYGKMIRKYNKFKAHDENNTAKTGDTVLIEETRPLSKDKRFRVVKLIKKAQMPLAEIKEEIQ
ncbi:MAG: 30S ribosomal protein S17 [Omnitrophica WOR_2 bacterium RBG_13_44_8b]|nr:MAG: 30S ribosomal protein S17 [Omnitrophica WOR_2 bacterium RBG_13_44_8b]